MSLISTFNYGNKKYAVGEERFSVLDSDGNELVTYRYEETYGASAVQGNNGYFDCTISLFKDNSVIIKLPDTPEGNQFYLEYRKQKDKFN
ncbi:hypothetical protein FHS19_006828 [Paenibacillus rhizosphaerae]|uniref:Uncharacterized protein n=1 Tax=Paenibacillus rhizosphaerae TaxID=297318 RepID=A0A839U064_9BACL|nr:hypothetical protein [Paenibacillus rhizosphaerae]MBB3132101.1 hypothetical protein [Paenibacillus rhizosphaerae]